MSLRASGELTFVSSKNPATRVLLLAILAALGLHVAGCARHRDASQICDSGYYPGPPSCFGHFSTCWRAWPEECVSCPPFSQGTWEATVGPVGNNTPGAAPTTREDLNPGTIPAEEVRPPESLPPPAEPRPRKIPAFDGRSSSKTRNPLRQDELRQSPIVRVTHDQGESAQGVD